MFTTLSGSSPHTRLYSINSMYTLCLYLMFNFVLVCNLTGDTSRCNSPRSRLVLLTIVLPYSIAMFI